MGGGCGDSEPRHARGVDRAFARSVTRVLDVAPALGMVIAVNFRALTPILSAALLGGGCYQQPGADDSATDTDGTSSGTGNPTPTSNPNLDGEPSTSDTPVDSSSSSGGGSESGPIVDGTSTGEPGDTGSGSESDSGSTGTPICNAPVLTPCDDADDDVLHAIGLNCDGLTPYTTAGAPQAITVHTGTMGTSGAFPPQEGSKMLVMSTGVAADMAVAGAPATTDLTTPEPDPGATLPAPLTVAVVGDGATNCADDPSLVGTGDCSNTLNAVWAASFGMAFDYVDVRATITVPADTTAFSYRHAFFATDYPDFYMSEYHDLPIAWLESEDWTGNVAFDAPAGATVNLASAFVTLKDAPNPIDCPEGCTAPELAGTAMQGHAGTPWLRTTVPVNPGETITMIWSMVDLSDGTFDSVILIDGFEWGCDSGVPLTVVAG
jgi:hypothetical protein